MLRHELLDVRAFVPTVIDDLVTTEMDVVVVEEGFSVSHDLFHDLPGQLDRRVELSLVLSVTVERDVLVLLTPAP